VAEYGISKPFEGRQKQNFLLLRAPDRYYTGFSWYDLPPRQLPGIVPSRKLLCEVLAETARNGYSPGATFYLDFRKVV
jgi:phospholipase/carboxylesterase